MQYQNTEHNGQTEQDTTGSLYNPVTPAEFAPALDYVERNLNVIIAEMKAMQPAAALVYGSFRMYQERDTYGSRGWLVVCLTAYEPNFANL